LPWPHTRLAHAPGHDPASRGVSVPPETFSAAWGIDPYSGPLPRLAHALGHHPREFGRFNPSGNLPCPGGIDPCRWTHSPALGPLPRLRPGKICYDGLGVHFATVGVAYFLGRLFLRELFWGHLFGGEETSGSSFAGFPLQDFLMRALVMRGLVNGRLDWR
jgi:hypothetical protein